MASLGSHLSFASGSKSNGDRTPHLFSLPSETLEVIFRHVDSRDLPSLLRVSRTCRDLAAAQLYRIVSHLLPDSDRGDGGVDRLAAVLETLTSSDYNYARYIKEISMESVMASPGLERQSRESRYEYSSSKFLNALLLATLKRVIALEKFKWNVRVEISQSVFTVLSSVPSLQHVHIRLQPGSFLQSSFPSFSSPSPPPPPPPPPPVPLPASTHSHQPHHHHHSNLLFPPPNHPALGSYLHQKSTSASKDVRPIRKPGTGRANVESQTFSRFSGLKSLAVLDIDALEYVPEISQCMSRSSSSLKSLKLSFSERLALKARKKAVIETSDTETLPDDDFDDLNQSMPPPLPPPPLIANTGGIFGPAGAPSTSNHADVRKERSAQEKVLAQIFGLDKVARSESRLELALEEAIVMAEREARTLVKMSSERDEDKLFIRRLREIALDISAKRPGGARSSRHLKALEKLEKAASRYLERKDITGSLGPRQIFADAKKRLDSMDHNLQAESNFGQSSHWKNDVDHQQSDWAELDTDKYQFHESQLPDLFSGSSVKGQSAAAGNPGKSHPSVSFSVPVQPSELSTTLKGDNPASNINDGVSEGSASSNKATHSHFGASENSGDGVSDIVDMEHPDVDSDPGEDQAFVEDSGDDTETLLHSGSRPNGQVEPTKTLLSGFGEEKASLKEFPEAIDMNEDQEDTWSEGAIKNYLRQNHGISLEYLSVHLIPVKPWVLCRAIDICSLKHISLLNVGPQRNLWAMLMKLQKSYPLRLTSIHSDNVTQSFLSFVDSLDELTELFMIERSTRSKVESFASKTTMTIEDIRKNVLKKHIRTLRRLVIRNDEDSGWALNRKSVLMINKHGSHLRELMVGLASSNFHLFMQHMAGLHSLSALQILFHHRENCDSMLREIRLCIIDNIVQSSVLGVEYVAVCLAINGLASNSVIQLKRKTTLMTPANEMKHEAFRSQRNSSETPGPGSIFGPSSDIKGKGKAKSSYQGMYVDVEHVEHVFKDRIPWHSDDSDEDDSYTTSDNPILNDNLNVSEIVGVKMWERETWGLGL